LNLAILRVLTGNAQVAHSRGLARRQDAAWRDHSVHPNGHLVGGWTIPNQ
jgi:hypothetical protein